MKSIREMPDLFRLVGRLPINSYFVREDDGLTLVDANLPGRATKIVEIALRLELPIRRIVLTHAHMDHTGSLDAICELLPSADVFIGARESRLLEQNFTLDRTEPQKKIRGRFAPVKTQPGLLDPGDHVGSLRALSTPGHTPGHFSFFDERNGALLTGDAFQTAGGWPWPAICGCSFLFPRSSHGTRSWRSRARTYCGISIPRVSLRATVRLCSFRWRRSTAPSAAPPATSANLEKR